MDGNLSIRWYEKKSRPVKSLSRTFEPWLNPRLFFIAPGVHSVEASTRANCGNACRTLDNAEDASRQSIALNGVVYVSAIFVRGTICNTGIDVPYVPPWWQMTFGVHFLGRFDLLKKKSGWPE